MKPALKQLHWLPVEERIIYKLCLEGCEGAQSGCDIRQRIVTHSPCESACWTMLRTNCWFHLLQHEQTPTCFQLRSSCSIRRLSFRPCHFVLRDHLHWLRIRDESPTHFASWCTTCSTDRHRHIYPELPVALRRLCELSYYYYYYYLILQYYMIVENEMKVKTDLLIHTCCAACILPSFIDNVLFIRGSQCCSKSSAR